MLESFGLMHTSVPLLLDAGRKQRCVFKGPTVCFLGVSICIYVCVCVSQCRSRAFVCSRLYTQTGTITINYN